MASHCNILDAFSGKTAINYYIQRGYIYGAVKGHCDAMFTAAVQLLDGAKPNTNSKTAVGKKLAHIRRLSIRNRQPTRTTD